MANPEMARIEGRRFICPCGTANQSMFLRCTAQGTNDIAGYCLKCWTCGRVISADGVVLRQVAVIG